ncbi:MAG: hypothetical protein KDA37_05475 [Planctomycetales bacterium]|nr:hypothetical protein [Planctomycetales bacterium]
MEEFRQIIQALASERVEGILVGGVAGALRGAARPTRDVDLLYERSPDNYDRIVAALEPLSPYLRGAPPNLPFLFDARTIAAGGNFTLATTAGDVDLLASIAGGDFDSLLEHTEVMKVFGCECRVLDLETLIRVKRAAGRPKDFAAIAELELIAENRRIEGE